MCELHVAQAHIEGEGRTVVNEEDEDKEQEEILVRIEDCIWLRRAKQACKGFFDTKGSRQVCLSRCPKSHDSKHLEAQRTSARNLGKVCPEFSSGTRKTSQKQPQLARVFRLAGMVFFAFNQLADIV